MTSISRILFSALLAMILLTIIAGPVLGYTYGTKSDRQSDDFTVYLVPAIGILILVGIIITLISKRRKTQDTHFEIPDTYKSKLSADEKIIGQATWKNSTFIAADKRLLKCTGDNCEALSYEQISGVKKVYRINTVLAQVVFAILAIIAFIVTVLFWTDDSVPRLVTIGTAIIAFDIVLIVVFTPLLMKVKRYEITGKNLDAKTVESWTMPPDNIFADKLKKQIDDSRR